MINVKIAKITVSKIDCLNLLQPAGLNRINQSKCISQRSQQQLLIPCMFKPKVLVNTISPDGLGLFQLIISALNAVLLKLLYKDMIT